jgi:hypothetical protein
MLLIPVQSSDRVTALYSLSSNGNFRSTTLKSCHHIFQLCSANYNDKFYNENKSNTTAVCGSMYPQFLIRVHTGKNYFRTKRSTCRGC